MRKCTSTNFQGWGLLIPKSDKRMMDGAFSQTFEFFDGIIRVRASCFASFIVILHSTPLTWLILLLSRFINLLCQILTVIHP